MFNIGEYSYSALWSHLFGSYAEGCFQAHGGAVGRILQCDKREIVAFGDNFVDLELLQYAGLGVAMGNAPQEVKQAVGRVTIPNNVEGIYTALQHLRFSAPKQVV